LESLERNKSTLREYEIEFCGFVMNATADDWESLEQIMPDAIECCDVSDRSTVVRVIVTLVEEGLLEEMRKRPITSELILQNPIEYWFAMTASGRSLWATETRKYDNKET
jgi:hypothetical protein